VIANSTGRKIGLIGRCLLLCVCTVLLMPAGAYAHWCSNIYQTYARIVVKPERQTINLGMGESGDLIVRARNNFPYTLHYILLRANPPSELSVSVSPTESEAQQKPIYAGQEATFTLHITRNQAGSDDVSALNLEVNADVSGISGWRDMGDWWVDQNPAAADVRNSLSNDPQQSQALLNFALAEVPGSSNESDGVNGLIDLWVYRAANCVSSNFDSTNPMQGIRAGLQLAIRLRYRNFNDPSRATVVQAMIDAMDDPYEYARGYGAFLAAYGGNDAGVSTRIQAIADSDPAGSCSYSASTAAQRMAKAALLILGQNQYHTEVTDCVNDGGEDGHVRAACAAALGIMGEDAPVTGYLMPATGNGSSPDYDRLFASYLLQLVVYSRRGGPEGIGVVSFLDEEVIQDDVPPRAPTGLSVQPAS